MVKLKLRQLRQLSKLTYFQFDHFPMSKIDSESRFEMRMSIFLFNFFMERFDHHKKMFNNGFPVEFSKSDFGGGDRFSDGIFF